MEKLDFISARDSLVKAETAGTSCAPLKLILFIMNIRDFVKQIENGGASYNIHTNELNPKEGYFVSLPDKGEVVPFDEKLTLIVSMYIHRVSEFLVNNPEVFLGGWLTKDTNEVHLDCSVQIMDKREAIEKGIAWGQLAIYDAAKGEDIKLPTPQRTGTDYQKRSYIQMKINELLG